MSVTSGRTKHSRRTGASGEEESCDDNVRRQERMSRGPLRLRQRFQENVRPAQIAFCAKVLRNNKQNNKSASPACALILTTKLWPLSLQGSARPEQKAPLSQSALSFRKMTEQNCAPISYSLLFSENWTRNFIVKLGFFLSLPAISIMSSQVYV